MSHGTPYPERLDPRVSDADLRAALSERDGERREPAHRPGGKACRRYAEGECPWCAAAAVQQEPLYPPLLSAWGDDERHWGWAWLIAYVGTVYGANWALKTLGFIDIGFGLTAPAGVLFAGLAFTFRDLTREALGREWCLIAIAVGAALSWLLEDIGRIALASAIAFGLSECLDFAVYEPLRKRGWLIAVMASNAAGLVLDSALFLWLAFGSLDFIEGQIVGKAYMTALAVGVLWLARRRFSAISPVL